MFYAILQVSDTLTSIKDGIFTYRRMEHRIMFLLINGVKV